MWRVQPTPRRFQSTTSTPRQSDQHSSLSRLSLCAAPQSDEFHKTPIQQNPAYPTLIDYREVVPVISRTPRLLLGGVTAFVVTVVGLAPFLESQSRSIWSGDRFWSIGTIGAGVLAVVAVGTAAGLA